MDGGIPAGSKTAMVKRYGIALAGILAGLVLLAAFSGCADSSDPAYWLERCREETASYVQEGGYLHFRHEQDQGITIIGERVDQKIEIDGESIFPDRQRYLFQETLSRPDMPDATQRNSFTYLTVDGGETAYVEGERISVQLGIDGWVHYTPPEGENRYFDYASQVDRMTQNYSDAELVGFEEVDGVNCAHLRYRVDAAALTEKMIQEDPSMKDKYEGMDLGEVLQHIMLDIWVGEEDALMRKVLLEQAVFEGEAGSITLQLSMTMSGYGEEPPLSIEQPDSFTETV